MKNQVSCFILIGFKSSGKSYFGNLLAATTSFIHFDTDLLIENFYERRFGERLSCRNIALKSGEAFFRTIENSAIAELDPDRPSVISTGGGTLLHPENCTKLKSLGPFIYLNASPEMLSERLRKNTIPSFIDPVRPEESLRNLYAKRKPIYERTADYTVDLEKETEDAVLKTLKKIIVENNPI